jgi:3-methyladenine DNA glycosylase AlkD
VEEWHSVMDKSQLIEEINFELRSQADSDYRERVRSRYNMNVDNFWGVRTPMIHKIAGKFYKTFQSENIAKRIVLAEYLLRTRIYEHKIMAFRWCYLARKDFSSSHLDVFAKWLDEYIDDWIDCDDLCIHVIGEFFLNYPDSAEEVIHWTYSSNPWVRRGAAVSLVLPVRKGHQLNLVFRIADLLMLDEVGLVKKGYGWLLKVASKTYPDEVYHYVITQCDNMPRVSLRYAIEKLPKHLQDHVLEKANRK